MTLKRVIVAMALILVLAAPVCICYPQGTLAPQGDCHGMPDQGQTPNAPACCSVSPSPQPLLAASVHYDGPSVLATATVTTPDLLATEQQETGSSSSLPKSPPNSNSILRI